MKNKKYIMVLIVSLILLSLVACNQGGVKNETDKVDSPDMSISNAEIIPMNLKIAYGAAEGSTIDLYAKKIKDVLQAKSNGEISVDVFPNAQLGADSEILAGCQDGSISMIILQPMPIANFIPEFAIFDIPNTFSGINPEKVQNVLNGNIKERLNEKANLAGFKVLDFASGDSFRVTSSNKAIRSFEDFKGLKIRTIETPVAVAYWQALGATPTPLAFSELYIALQQGLVSAQENAYETIVSAKLYEQQKYIINTNHLINTNVVLINNDLFKGMSDVNKTLLDETMKEATPYACEQIATLSMNMLKELEANGLEIIDLSEKDIEILKEKAKVCYEMVVEKIGDQLPDMLLNELNK